MKSYKFRINGNEYNVEINSVEGNVADVTVNGADYKVEMENAGASTGSVASTDSATGTGSSTNGTADNSASNTGRNAATALRIACRSARHEAIGSVRLGQTGDIPSSGCHH